MKIQAQETSGESADESSLFYGISEERRARLLSITVGGRSLFDESGRVVEDREEE